MDYLVIRDNRLISLAFVASLVVHALVLSIRFAAPGGIPQEGENRPNRTDSRLDVALSKQPRPEIKNKLAQQRKADSPKRILRRLAPPREPGDLAAAKEWTIAEREEMDDFLNDLAVAARPPGGREMAQRALALARHMRNPVQRDVEAEQVMQKLVDARVDRFSIEMYFDAMFRKMNQSASMTSNQAREKGKKAAAVRFVLNENGTVKNFQVLHAADQQAEIDFVKAVIDRAAPFPAFPPDIRGATDALVVMICIKPGIEGSISGATFSRMGSGQDCR